MRDRAVRCSHIRIRLLLPCVLMVIGCGDVPRAWGQEGLYDWKDVALAYPGVKLAKVHVETPRPIDIFCLRVDLTTPGLRLRGTERAPDWSAGGQETIRETTRDFLTRHRQAGTPMVVAINANFFTPWPAPWNKQTPSDLTGLAVSDGVVVSPAQKGLYSLVAYDDHTAAIIPTDPSTPLDHVQTAISGYRCLNAGAPDGSGPDLQPRTAAGVSQDKSVVYLMVIDGRRHASQGATLQELGAWLKHFGAWNGINLDGGGSTTMVRWVAGQHQAELVNNPVGNGANWLEVPPIVERTTYKPSERCNGNNLGVVVSDQER